MEEKKDNSFVRETIKERPMNRKKLLRRTVVTAIMAVIFGLVACLTFLLLEPVINKKLNPKQISKVEFPEEEVSPNKLLTEETVLKQEQKQEEQVRKEAKEEAREETILQLENTKGLSVDSYEELHKALYDIAKGAEKSIVSVIGVSEREDWLAGNSENQNITSGLIIANNGVQLLILADINRIGQSQKYYIRFSENQILQAQIKQKDSQTGLVVLSVSLDDLSEDTLKNLQIATLGRSTDSFITGKPVIAIGGPMGTLNSISYGMITANTKTISMVDSIYHVLQTDMNNCSDTNGVLIDYSGNVVGFITDTTNQGQSNNTICALGISEIRTLIEVLSNGQDRVFIGIKGVDVTELIHQEMGVPYGAYVTEVVSQSPAMKEGILNGDIITLVNDHTISSFQELRSVLMSLKKDTTVRISLYRFNGKEYVPIDVELMPEVAN